MMRKVSFLVWLSILFMGSEGIAQYSARVTLDSGRALIGSPLKLRLDVGPLPAKTVVSWPQIPDSFRALSRAGEVKIDTVVAGGQVRYLREYPFVGLDSGIFEVPRLAFGIGSQKVQSTPVAIHLYPPDVDTTKPIDPIRDIIAAPAFANWKPWVIGAVVLLLAGLLLWFWIRKRKKSTTAPVVKAPSKGFAALLRELEAEGLPQRGEYRQYYTRLTDILRDAVAVKGGFKTREITSSQLLRKAGKILQAMPQQQLRAILEEADAVKFAKLQPTLAQQEAVLQLAFAFLQNARL